MERTKFALPDAINCSKQDNFTIIPTEFIRNPNISGNAKALLSLLLSNKDGWKSCIETIKKMMKEKDSALNAAIRELEKNKYLIRLRYRDKTTKRLIGSFWAYTKTPGDFDIQNNIKILQHHNLEVVEPQVDFPQVEKPQVEKPQVENQGLNILIDNNTNNKKINSFSNISFSLSKKLSNIIQSNKNIQHTQKQIKQWAKDIDKMYKESKIEYNRMNFVLNWYKKNIGGQYIPVIESGRSFREKFIKLEAAISRDLKTVEKPKFKIEYGERWELQSDGKYRNKQGQIL